MSGVMFGAGALALVAFWGLGRMASSSTKKTMDAAIDTGDVSALYDALVAARDPSTAFDAALGELWRTYHRETAIKLVAHAAERIEPENGAFSIVQFWLDKALTVEPELCVELLSMEWVQAHLDPETVAQTKSSGCGGSCSC